MVDNKLELPIMIDYAHSPESLQKTLKREVYMTKKKTNKFSSFLNNPVDFTLVVVILLLPVSYTHLMRMRRSTTASTS